MVESVIERVYTYQVRPGAPPPSQRRDDVGSASQPLLASPCGGDQRAAFAAVVYMRASEGGNWLDGEAFAPSRPTALDDVTAVARGHARTESVLALARDALRLPSSLGHVDLRLNRGLSIRTGCALDQLG